MPFPHNLPSSHEIHFPTPGAKRPLASHSRGRWLATRDGGGGVQTLRAQSPFAGGQCTFFFPKKKKVPKKKLATLQVNRFCDRQLCRPKLLFPKYAVHCLISALPEITKF